MLVRHSPRQQADIYWSCFYGEFEAVLARVIWGNDNSPFVALFILVSARCGVVVLSARVISSHNHNATSDAVTSGVVIGRDINESSDWLKHATAC